MPQTQPQPTFIQQAIQQSIRQNPEAAAREVPEIVGYYILNNTLLNDVYQSARRYVDNQSARNLFLLCESLQEAERGSQ